MLSAAIYATIPVILVELKFILYRGELMISRGFFGLIVVLYVSIFKVSVEANLPGTISYVENQGVDFSSRFQRFISQYVNLRESDGKISIPEHIKHVKLDIGLSYNAPMSQYWLTHEEDLLVFGFEPNPGAVKILVNGAIKQNAVHGDPLELRFINESFFLIPCALGLSKEPVVNFYVTKNDCGTSSIYKPNYFEVSNIIEVPIFTLVDFFDIFPFDTHPVIDYIKIDAQGSDLNIVKSAGSYLSERVVFVTIEAENSQYKNTNNSVMEIDRYMQSIGFLRDHSKDTSDPTFINSLFLDYAKENAIKIYQRG